MIHRASYFHLEQEPWERNYPDISAEAKSILLGGVLAVSSLVSFAAVDPALGAERPELIDPIEEVQLIAIEFDTSS